jgi:ribosomal protein S18 acetylase RimI-like enzyme
MLIARVTPANLQLLDQVADDVFDGAVALEYLSACVADPTHILVVAAADRQVVGQCLAMIQRHPDRANELYIADLGVAPAFQRCGLARQLLEQVVAAGQANGCIDMWVGAEPDNAAANALYRSFGLSLRVANIFEAEF